MPQDSIKSVTDLFNDSLAMATTSYTPQNTSLVPTMTPDTFLYGILAVIFFYFVLPVAVRFKKSREVDPTAITIQTMAKSIAAIEIKLNDSVKPGMLDEALSIKKFHNAIKFSMLQCISLYHERLRKNHILRDRHIVLGRYHRGGEEISGKLYVDLNGYTCMTNGRKLSGFLNTNGGDLLFHRITEELFENHLAQAKEQSSFLNEEDVESALDRFTSIIISEAKKWMQNDKKNLISAWDDIESKVKFILEADEIEYLTEES